MIDFIKLLISKTWELFSIPWPGFEFSIGSVFLAVAVSVGALTAFMKMIGVSFLGGFSLGFSRQNFKKAGLRGGNNKNIKVSKERKHDTK